MKPGILLQILNQKTIGLPFFINLFVLCMLIFKCKKTHIQTHTRFLTKQKHNSYHFSLH